MRHINWSFQRSQKPQRSSAVLLTQAVLPLVTLALSACGWANPPTQPGTSQDASTPQGIQVIYQRLEGTHDILYSGVQQSLSTTDMPIQLPAGENISARWSAYFTVPTSGRYQFILPGNTPAKIFLNGERIDPSQAVALNAGQEYTLHVSTLLGSHEQSFSLSWSINGQRKNTLDSGVFTPLSKITFAKIQAAKDQLNTQGVISDPTVILNETFEDTSQLALGWSASMYDRTTWTPINYSNALVSPGRNGSNKALRLGQQQEYTIQYFNDWGHPEYFQVGAEYTFSAWVKANGAALCSFNNYGLPTPAGAGVTNTNDQFVQSQAAATLNSLPTSFTVNVINEYQTGPCDIDDITINVTRPASALPDPAVNYVVNGEMNSSDGIGADQWNIWSAKSPMPNTVVMPGWDDTGAAFGQTATAYYSISGNQTISASRLKPNTDYIFKAKLRGVSNPQACTLTLQEVNTWTIIKRFRPFSATDWYQGQFKYTTGATVANDLVINISNGGGGSKPCAIDDIKFGPLAADTTALPPLPTANPVYIPNPIATVGGGLSFDASSVDADTYSWSFSDGTVDSGAYVEHTFATTGRHTATLTVSRTTGETQTYTSQVAVLPEIQNVVKQRATTNTMTVIFDAGDPVDGLTYTYTFGDGTTGTGSKVSHTYTKIGTYDYRLTITDNRMTTQALRAQSGIRAQALGDKLYDQTSWHTIWQKAPQAKFSIQGMTTPIAVAKGTATPTFNATNSSDPNSPASPLTYAWDFGDNTTGTGVTTTHTYSTMGKYVVTLTVTNGYGLTDTYRDIIHIRDPKSNFVLNVQQSTPITGQALPTPGADAPRLKAQDANSTAQDYFPYVVPVSNKVVSGIFRSLNVDGTKVPSFCNQLTITVNGTTFSGTNLERPDLGTDATGQPYFCDGVLFTNQLVMQDKTISSIFVTSSRYINDVWFNVFSKLAVPRVVISVLPDEYITGSLASPAVKEYQNVNPDTGKNEWVLMVNIRQSEVNLDNTLKVKIPVLALDSTGAYRTNATGRFKATFLDSTLNSDCGDCTMVNGRAYITVTLPVNKYTPAQQILDLNNIVLGTDNGCNSIDVMNLRLSGCATIPTVNDFPTARAPETPVRRYPIATKIFNHIFYDTDTVNYGKIKQALGAYAQVGYTVSHAYVEYAAPYLLLQERYEELQQLTDALIADGKLSTLDAGKIILANVAVWASVVPQGPLKPPSFASVANMSRNDIGATSSALEKVAAPDVVKGLKTSDVNNLLNQYAHYTAKFVELCKDQCASLTDEAIDFLVKSGTTYQNALKNFESIVSKSKSGEDDITAIAIARNIALTCKNLGTLSIRPLTLPNICLDQEFQELIRKAVSGGKRTPKQVSAIQENIRLLDAANPSAAKKVYDVIKSRQYEGIDGYDKLISSLTGSGTSFSSGFSVYQAFDEAEALIQRGMSIKFEVKYLGGDVDVAGYVNGILDTAKQLKSTDGFSSIKNALGKAVRQLNAVSVPAKKYATILIKNENIANFTQDQIDVLRKYINDNSSKGIILEFKDMNGFTVK